VRKDKKQKSGVCLFVGLSKTSICFKKKMLAVMRLLLGRGNWPGARARKRAPTFSKKARGRGGECGARRESTHQNGGEKKGGLLRFFKGFLGDGRLPSRKSKLQVKKRKTKHSNVRPANM